MNNKNFHFSFCGFYHLLLLFYDIRFESALPVLSKQWRNFLHVLSAGFPQKWDRKLFVSCAKSIYSHLRYFNVPHRYDSFKEYELMLARVGEFEAVIALHSPNVGWQFGNELPSSTQMEKCCGMWIIQRRVWHSLQHVKKKVFISRASEVIKKQTWKINWLWVVLMDPWSTWQFNCLDPNCFIQVSYKLNNFRSLAETFV